MADIKIAVDCMGGDNAPFEIIKGALTALKEDRMMSIDLVGKESEIKKVIAEIMSEDLHIKTDNVSITDASEIIDTAEHPVKAIRGKKAGNFSNTCFLLSLFVFCSFQTHRL